MSNTNQHTPEGMIRNRKGGFDPISQVKDIDLQRHELVGELADEAKELNKRIAQFKRKLADSIETHVQLCGEKYGITLGGTKGNVTLTNYDQTERIIRSISETIDLDERMVVAQELMTQYANTLSQTTQNEEVKALINWAFQADRKGKLNTNRILELRKLKITHETWQRAMDALNESLFVAGSKTYYRVYQRPTPEDEYKQISLEMSKV